MRSLCLLASSGGGLHALPPLSSVRILLNLSTARTLATRAAADLDCHFTPEWLAQRVSPDGRSRREWLYDEYVRNNASQRAAEAEAEPSHVHVHVLESPLEPQGGEAAALLVARSSSPSPPSPSASSLSLASASAATASSQAPGTPAAPLPHSTLSGQDYQVWAAWNHTLREAEATAIRSAGLPVLVVHGRRDVIADATSGRRLARRLKATFLLVDGSHMVQRECAPAINPALARLIAAAEMRWQLAVLAAADRSNAPHDARATWLWSAPWGSMRRQWPPHPLEGHVDSVALVGASDAEGTAVAAVAIVDRIASSSSSSSALASFPAEAPRRPSMASMRRRPGCCVLQ